MVLSGVQHMNRNIFYTLFLVMIIGHALWATQSRGSVVVDFEFSPITLYSYPGEDLEPNAWEISTDFAYNGTAKSLLLYGNTWKLMDILPREISATTLWQIAVYYPGCPDYAGFLVSDGQHELRYSFCGQEVISIDEWVTVYQGSQMLVGWHYYTLPIGHDWLARFDSPSEITTIGFVNNEDIHNAGEIYFDEIYDITDSAPVAPQVSIVSSSRHITGDGPMRSMQVHFASRVIDPDSDNLSYFWDFGDNTSSTEANPAHSFLIADKHSYHVVLTVTDETNLIGMASQRVLVDPGPSSLPLTINFAGDVMLARNIASQIVVPNQNADMCFEPTREILGNAADITAVNLETPFTIASQPHPTKSIWFKSPPIAAPALANAGIDYVTLANNHIYDFLEEGMQETMMHLNTIGMLYSGAGMNSAEAALPVVMCRKGISVAFCASSDRNGQYNNAQPYLDAGYDKPGFALMTPYNIQQQIQQVRDDADVVIMQLHAGSEYSLFPGQNYDNSDYLTDENWRLDIPHMWDIEMRHFAIDAGADAVIVHHPHVIQGIEVYKGKVIAHSLGNFVFDLSYAETKPSMILNAEIDETGIHNYTITPVFINNLIPQPATGELGLHILRYIANRSAELHTTVNVRTQENKAEVVLDPSSAVSFTTTAHCQATDFQQEDNGWFYSDPIPLSAQGSISRIMASQPASGMQVRFGREHCWQGNMEDEGADLWYLNSIYEGYTDEEALRGERSITHSIPASSSSNIITTLRDKIRRMYSTEYSVFGWVKTETALDVGISVRCYEHRGDNYNSYLSLISTPTLDGTNDWTYLHANLFIPDSTAFFNIIMNTDHQISQEAHSWFDDVGLVQWDQWYNVNEEFHLLQPNNYSHLQLRSMDSLSEADVTYQLRSCSPFIHSDDRPSFPTPARCLGNYPNPFNISTTISYQLDSSVIDPELEIYNMRGQLVYRCAVNPAVSSIVWKGTDNECNTVASGVYMYQIVTSGTKSNARKCILLK